MRVLRFKDAMQVEDEGGIELTVQHDGEGIPFDKHHIVTERFKQLQPTSGSGLGLAIAKTVAEQHGGSLTLESLDAGLKVRLCFGSPAWAPDLSESQLAPER